MQRYVFFDLLFSFFYLLQFTDIVSSTRLQQAAKAVRLRELAQREPNRMAKASESDRMIRTKMPKHLFSGKRKGGKTNRR